MSERTGLRETISAQRDRIRGKRKTEFAYRIIVSVLGVAIIALGVVLLPLPGPGWLIIFLGLGVLASEFEWASRLLAYAKRRVGEWTDWVRRQSLFVRFLLGTATLAIVAAAIYGYHLWRGLPGWIPGIE